MDVETVVGMEICNCFREVLEGIFTLLQFIRGDKIAEGSLATAKESLRHPFAFEVGHTTLQITGMYV